MGVGSEGGEEEEEAESEAESLTTMSS